MLRRYLAAQRRYELAKQQLSEAKADFVALLIERRKAGERATDIAADLGVKPGLVVRLLAANADWQDYLKQQSAARLAAYESAHEKRMARLRTIVERANAGVDVREIASEFQISTRRVEKIAQQCQWVLEP